MRLTCVRDDGTQYDHHLSRDDFAPDLSWEFTVPEGVRQVGGAAVRPGDKVSGRLEIC